MTQGRHEVEMSGLLERIRADSDWWKEVSVRLPWTLHGFTYRRTAEFSTGDPNGHLVTLTGHERNQLLGAFKEERA